MRKLFVILLAAVLAAPALSGQVAPDNDDIFEQTINNESPYYYPALMLRYNSGDTTLTEKDYYYLYYGYAFSDDYHPLAPIPAEDKVLMAFETAHGDPSEENMRDIIRYAEEVMRSDPFSPTNLNFLAYAYGAVGDTLNERINYDRLNKVLAAISASGDGVDGEVAYACAAVFACQRRVGDAGTLRSQTIGRFAYHGVYYGCERETGGS